MNTSSEAVKQLEASLASARQAKDTIENLIAEHDYQDVAQLVAQAAVEMLTCAKLLMEKADEAAFDAMDKAEDLLDQVYAIIEGELDDE
jgi:hypothetical protein